MTPKLEMDPRVATCVSVLNLGNDIAKLLVKYFGTAKSPPVGLYRLAVELLETGRVLCQIRNGLASASVAHSYASNADSNDELLERMDAASSTLAWMYRMTERLMEIEKKNGFGKIGKSLRMMSAITDLDKLKKSMAHCQETLRSSVAVFSMRIAAPGSEILAGDGFATLAAVLHSRRIAQFGPHTLLFQADVGHMGVQDGDSVPAISTSASHDSFQVRHVHESSLGESSLIYAASIASEHDVSTGDSQSITETTLKSQTDKDNSPRTGTGCMGTTVPGDYQQALGTLCVRARGRKQDNHGLSLFPRQTVGQQLGSIPRPAQSTLLEAVCKRDYHMIKQLLRAGTSTEGESERSPLIEAVALQDMESIRLLLSSGANANATDTRGMTPLYAATEVGFYEAAQMILDYGGDPDLCASKNGDSPLAAATTDSRAPFAQLYLKHGARTDIIMENGNTPFIHAVDASSGIEILEMMTAHGADLNRKNARGESALFKAIAAGRLDLVHSLLDHGADPNLPAPKHLLWTAVRHQEILRVLLEQGANLKRAPGILELATSINSLEAMICLMKHGADPNAKKDGIYTPLCSAIRDDREELVETLLAVGANPNLPALDYPVFKCVSYHRPNLLQKLIAAGADLSNPRGIVEHAVVHNDRECLVIVLGHGVDINVRGQSGSTALTTAICKGRIDMIDLLLSHGADPKVRGQEWPINMAVGSPEILSKLLAEIQAPDINKGALERAVMADQIESVKLLLAKGVNVDDKNVGVFTPLTTSIRENRKAIFRYLLDEAGANPNLPGEHLPLIKAIRRHSVHDLSYIRHLIERGADINLMYRGCNAVLQALDNGETEVFKLLATHGAPDLNVVDDSGNSVLSIMQERKMEQELQILLGGKNASPQMTDTPN